MGRTGEESIRPEASSRGIPRRAVFEQLSAALRRGRLQLRRRYQRYLQLKPVVRELLTKERRSVAARRVPWGDRLDCWRHGFLSESRVIYDFDRNPRGQYLSDYARFAKNRINGPYTALLNNKVMFDAVMQPFQSSLPVSHAAIIQGAFRRLRPGSPLLGPESVIPFVLESGSLVIKPINGGDGKGVRVLTATEGELRVNGVVTEPAALAPTLAQLDLVIIQERLEQAAYSARIYPHTTNTIRLLTVWEADAAEPFIAAAVHRFGSNRSAPVDNWQRGGYCAAIDLETGVMTGAATYPARGPIVWETHHPDTGARIEGECVPGWSALKSRILEVASAHPYWPYVGWDLVLDPAGEVKIVEGNGRSGVNVFQIHSPLLADPRVRKFLETA